MTEQQIIKTLATAVMGWRWIYHVELDLWGWHSPDEFRSGWNPLRNIADAFQVMDKLCIALIPQAGNLPEDMKYLAVFDDRPIGRKIEVFAKTAQEAICIVAIKVIKGREKER
ncbi:hypothetical protein SECTIM467_136 [Brevibacillus phage SecTim467]|uniref:Phage ABA sandwich domain-containing protein n=2 Tax=Jenstvirus jenst TaxID=1982225 RepID=A0A0K2CNQ9_9CAUD|nr:hypothetical protein AVV11_gp060 [Brevibacillus phage Jenst]ALA07260.1 hypothetical protein JENST_131 [Brevibacillus phage Jenst]ALA07462.1 hypothetical protein SECTIM467_136 [Brevibacillus phage SecTim467]